MTAQDETISARNAGQEEVKGRIHTPDSLEIERDIEETLSQMRGTLDEIQDNLSPGRVFAPLKAFFLSPAGRIILALAAVTIARRRPFLTTAAALGTIVLLYRRENRSNR